VDAGEELAGLGDGIITGEGHGTVNSHRPPKGLRRVGKASRRKRRDRPSSTRQPLAGAARVEDALRRLDAARQGIRLSLGAALGLGCAAVAVAIEDHHALPWYHRCDPIDLVFLGLLVPEEVEEEALFSNCRDAWLDAVTAEWGNAPFDELIGAALEVSGRTGTPIDDPMLALELAAELVHIPSALRPLPKSLLPQECLPGHRAFALPVVELGPPPAGGDRLVATFRASLDLELPNDGTIRDVLREGVRRLEREETHALEPLEAGDPPPVFLAAALHLASAADTHTTIDEVVVRTVDWICGLRPDSPLAPACDLALAAGEAGEPFDVALARLLALPEMDAPLSAADREYHSRVGHRAVALAAAQPRHPFVLTRSGTVKRVSGDSTAWIRSQQRYFEKAFGPRSDGPLFFDPERAEPSRLSLEAIHEATAEIMSILDLSEASRYAYDKTGLIPPSREASWPPGRLEGLLAARAEWGALHGVGDAELAASFAADVERCALFAAGATVSQARDDPEFAADMVASLEIDDSRSGTELLRLLGSLTVEQGLDESTVARAVEYARAWQGAELATASGKQ
jgi:hypothetical protein